MAENNKVLYRVKFREYDPRELRGTAHTGGSGADSGASGVVEVICQTVRPSELFGLVALEGLVFRDSTRFVILPDEDAARKRFGKSERLHVPYHNLLLVEEFADEVDVRKLPFIREVERPPNVESPGSVVDIRDGH